MSDQYGSFPQLSPPLTGGGAKKSTKKAASKKAASKKVVPKRGGAFAGDVKNLAIPFALSLLSKNWQDKTESKGKVKKGGGDWAPEDDEEPAPQLTGGAKKKKSPVKKTTKKAPSTKKMKQIKAEFMDITQAIHNFLAKH